MKILNIPFDLSSMTAEQILFSYEVVFRVKQLLHSIPVSDDEFYNRLEQVDEDIRMLDIEYNRKTGNTLPDMKLERIK